MSEDEPKGALNADTPTGSGDAESEGAGASPVPADEEHTDDPKSGGTPVHEAPGEDGPRS